MKLVHPSALSSFSKYRQVKALLKETGRASNSDWYRGPLSLDTQLHIFVSESEFDQSVLLVNSEKKAKIVTIPEPSQWADVSKMQRWLETFVSTHLPKKAKSLGVIVHIADEFSLAELGTDIEDVSQLGALRDTIFYSPQNILSDRTINPDERSWRVFPYHGSSGHEACGTAVSVSRRLQNLVQSLRDAGEANSFPVIVQALSAPLVALSLIPQTTTPAANRPFLGVLQYTTYSVLALFSAEGNLAQLRTLRHRGDFPPNIITGIQTMAASLGMADPSVHVLPMAGRAAAKTMMEFIFEQAPEMKPAQARMGLRVTDDGKHIRPEIAAFMPAVEEEKNTGAVSKLTSAVSLTRKWVLQAVPELGQTIENSATFAGLRDQSWHLQDFLPPSKEELEILPNPGDIKMLKTGGLLSKVAAIALLGVGSFVGYNLFKFSKDPAKAANAAPFVAEQKAASAQLADYTLYDELYKDRSRAWAAMELPTAIFTDPKLCKISSCRYGFSALTSQNPADKAGLSRTWTMEGAATPAALPFLNQIATKQGIAPFFDKLATLTGDTSFAVGTDPNRVVSVELDRSSAASRTAEQKDDYSISFKINVTQLIYSPDPLTFAAN